MNDTRGAMIKIARLREKVKGQHKPKLTQVRFAEMLSQNLGRRISREALAAWETDNSIRIPDDVVEFCKTFFGVSDAYLLRAYEGPPILTAHETRAPFGAAQYSTIVIRKGAGSKPWKDQATTKREARVPHIIGGYDEYIEIVDGGLMPAVQPGHIIGFVQTETVTMNKLHLLRSQKDPQQFAIREIRADESGHEVILFSPDPSAPELSFFEHDIIGLAVAHIRLLSPLQAEINEAGLSLAELQRAHS